MESIYFTQVFFLIFQCLIVAFILLTLFRLRSFFGLSLLLTTLGVFQYMQVFLANALYFEISEGIYVSSGSSVLFTGSIFAILLVYIKEDALEARKLIYAILSANVVLTILQSTISFGINNERFLNTYNLPIELFSQSFRISFSGTMLLFLDTFLIIFLYEAISKYIHNLFLKILISTVIILSIDTFAFATIAFYNTNYFQNVLISGLISKNFTAFIYTILFTIYIKYQERNTAPIPVSSNHFKDIFHTLTFRQKYEHMYAKSVQQEMALEKSEQKHQYFVEQTSEGFFKMASKRPIPTNLSIPQQIELMYKNLYIHECNETFAQMRGYTKSSDIIGISLKDIQGGLNKEVNYAALSKFISANYKTIDIETIGLDIDKNEKHFLNNTIGIIKDGMLIELWGTQRDITEKIETERALKEANTIINRSTSVAFLWNINAFWTAEYVSKNVENLFGYTAKEFLHKKITYLDLIHPDDREQVKNEIETNSKNKSLYYIKHRPYRIITKNNEIKWLQDNTFIRRNINGKITHYEGIVSDISEKITALENLKHQKEFLELLINHIPNQIFWKDQNLIYQGCNTLFSKVVGANSPEEVIGKSDFDFNRSNIYSEQYRACDKRILETGKRELNFEENYLDGDGKLGIVLTSKIPIKNSNQEILGVLGICDDITVQKKNLQIQKVLFNISNAVHTTSNLTQLIKLIKEDLHEIIDTSNFYIALYNEKNDTISLPFFQDENDHFKSIPAKNSITEYIIKNNEPLLLTGTELVHLAKENNVNILGTIPKHWLGVPIKVGGIVIGAIVLQNYKTTHAFNEDDKNLLVFVSHQIGLSIRNKKIEADLISALEKAKESDKLKTAFLQNISHEIRTPMNGILGFTELLKNQQLSNEKQQTFIDIISKSGERMLKTLNDLMDISKLETGQVKLNYSKISINEELSILFSLFNEEAKQKDLAFKLIIPQNTHPIISTDREKLFAVLSNLIKNALKYSKIGAINFGYNVQNNFLEFFVEDSGIGIPLNRQQAIFERFIQADVYDTEAYEGAGLGLSIAKSYVTMLGGKIWVVSEEQKGATFYFTIPKKHTIATLEKTVTKANNNKNNIHLNLLIVDDEEIAAVYLSILLEDFCTKIYRAKNGVEAVEIFKKNPTIDLILMDIKMPKMDGHEATQQIRALNKNVIIIAQTAFAYPEDQEKAMRYGCNDYISKPIQPTYLFELIKKYFEK